MPIQIELLKLTRLQIVEKTLELLSDESKWTRGAFARDGLGERCKAIDKHACQFCTVGAMRHICNDQHMDVILSIMNDMCIKLNIPAVPVWNDNVLVTHKEIVAGLRKMVQYYDSQSTDAK